MALMKFSTKITLYSSYFDMNDRLSAKSVLNIFQDVAGRHADDIGVGYLDMLNKNLYWILSRIKYDVIKSPVPNQTVIVETWPHEKGRIDFDRDFKISSEVGETLIIGTSKWCVIDTVTRSLQRTENVNYIGEVHPEINYDDKFGKISVPNENLTEQFAHIVRFSDLDHNKHMNNTNYALIATNSVDNKQFTHFEINFLSECLLGDTINVFYTNTENGEVVLGKNGEKNTFVCLMK
jgi:acyl-ACP thioesterase